MQYTRAQTFRKISPDKDVIQRVEISYFSKSRNSSAKISLQRFFEILYH